MNRSSLTCTRFVHRADLTFFQWLLNLVRFVFSGHDCSATEAVVEFGMSTLMRLALHSAAIEDGFALLCEGWWFGFCGEWFR